MEHPDKSLEATLYISVVSERIVKRDGINRVVATVNAVNLWRATPERAELMREYRARGHGLAQRAKDRLEHGGQTPLKAGLFEIAARRR